MSDKQREDEVDHMLNVIISITGFGIVAVLSRGAMASAARALASRGRSAGLR